MTDPALDLATRLRSLRYSVRGDSDGRVIVDRDGMSTVRLRAVDGHLKTARDVIAVGLDGIDAVVTVAHRGYWLAAAKDAAHTAGADAYNLAELRTALESKRFKGSQLLPVHHFIQTLNRHDRVERLVRVATMVFDIERKPPLDTVRVYVADEYMLSEQFANEALDDFPTTKLIANISPWNSSTSEAHETALRRDCLVVDRRELFGSLNKRADRITKPGR